MAVYELKVHKRGARPRSERLREMGSGSAGSTIVTVTGGGNVSTGNDHYHANKSALDQITTDADGYQYLTRLVEGTDGEGNEVYEQVTEKVKAGYADRAGMAHDLDPDSPVRDQFLSKLANDVAAGHITFEKGLTALLPAYFQDGAHFGNFVQGLAGAMIDRAGNAEFESITSRGYLKVFELIYNRLNALEGNTSFADVGTIETIEDGDNGAQVLTMRKRWDGDFTAFQPGDIVYGYVNDLNNGGASEYYKAWAWIKSVDRAANTLNVVPYADSEVPAGKNHPLTALMIITRRGNNVEANAYSYANKDYSAVIAKRGDNDYVNVRQTAFYISCEDGNIVELMGVNKPILEAGNYGTVLGKMPAGLLDPATQELVNKDQPYLFARGIIVQDLIRIDYGGKVTRTANYRGAWNAQIAASASDYYRSTPGTYDTVTWTGDLWQCVVSGTTDEPSETSGDWVNMTGRRKEKELRIWTINPTASIISVRKDEVRPETVGCTVSLYSSDNTTRLIESSYDLLQEGVKLYYSLDGIAWKEFIMGNTEPLDMEDGTGVIELEATDGDNILTVGGDDVDTAEIGDRVYFELREIETDMLLTATQVPVVKDGINGSFKSRAFKRTNSTNVETPTGGTYENPIPEGWEDGVPEGREILWTSVCTFYADGSSSGWSKPAQETDTATLDIEFSPNETQPEAPTGSTPFADHEAEGWYLSFDIHGYFMSIDKSILWEMMEQFIRDRYEGDDLDLLLWLARITAFHCPQKFCRKLSPPEAWNDLPSSKSLMYNDDNIGIAPGNLSSQDEANFYLTPLDHYIVKVKGFSGYVRFMDDGKVVSNNLKQLTELRKELDKFLQEQLRLKLHPKKVRIDHYSKGIKFVGYVLKPGRKYTTNRIFGHLYDLIHRYNCIAEQGDAERYAENFVSSINSYWGIMRHSNSYRRRVKSARWILPLWFKYVYIAARYEKLVLRPCYKPKFKARKMLKKRADGAFFTPEMFE